MNYNSTRDNTIQATAAKAIAQGISAEGGLFVPECIPQLSAADFAALAELDYKGRAKYILKYFLTDFTPEEIDRCVNGAYTGTFENEQPAPLVHLGENKYVLELWHGPTAAFKDLALQLLPYLMTTSAKKVRDGVQTVILVATSGDTGKAALEGFKDVENTKIIVFYPNNGVSAVQKLQMDSQQGNNVYVCAIEGNFDDAQTGVKKIFTNPQAIAALQAQNMEFSSANSINWGRLVPQIIYYVSAYCDLVKQGADLSDGFTVVVPTGNFGNILAAYYAKQMGVPVAKLVCASNANRILTDFINTGVYDRNRDFYTTISPSMDILISSNLERMLYELSGRNDALIAELQAQLAQNGKYTVPAEILEKLQQLYYGGCCDDAKTKQTIHDTYGAYGYLCDTHTAVAVAVQKEYQQATGDSRPTVIASTASPYKFSAAVLEGVEGKVFTGSEFETVERLEAITKAPVPAPIAALRTAKPRFKNVCQKEDMLQTVLDFLTKA